MSAGASQHQAVSRVEGARFEDPGASVSQVMRDAPGVQVTQSGGLGAPATASVRGATAAQTPVYLDQVRLNDEVGGVANLADLPRQLISQALVYRSHAPVGGAPGIGGAIVFVPKYGSAETLSLAWMAGNLGSRSIDGSVSYRDDQRSVIFGAIHEGARNDATIESSAGTLFVSGDDEQIRLRNADAIQNSVWMSGEEALGGARIRWLYLGAEREQGAPKLALTQSEQARAAFRRDLVALTARAPLEEGEIWAVTSASLGETQLFDPAREISIFSRELRTPGKRLEQVLGGDHELTSWIKVGADLVISLDQLDRFATLKDSGEQHELTARRVSGRVGVRAKGDLGRGYSSEVGAGLRMIGTGETGSSAPEDAYSDGQLSFGYAKNGISAGVTVGRYQRLPTLSELYGASLLVRGNSELQVEEGHSAELTLRYQSRPRGGFFGRFWAEASPFVRWSSNLIVFIRNAQGALLPRNRDSSRTLGAEVVLGGELMKGLDATLQTSLLDPRDVSPSRTTTNEILPFLSLITVSSRLDYCLDLLPAEGLSAHAGGRLFYQGSRFADLAGLSVIPDQVQVDFVLDMEWKPSGSGLRTTLRQRLANVLDGLRFDLVGYPLPGRSYFAELEVAY